MQNRYFGDVGDFTKYGLLRQAANCVKQLGILWCLAEDENHNNDGKHVTYLKKDTHKLFQSCDTELFDSLKAHLFDKHGNIIHANRSVSCLNDLQILPQNTSYFENIIKVSSLHRRKQDREAWFDVALGKLKPCDLVFCDPDNGIEVVSASKRTKKHFKYIFWDELEQLWFSGKSLIIYQHMHMGKPHIAQFKERSKDIVRILNTDMVLSIRCFRGTVRTYYLIPQPKHRQCFAQIVEFMTSGPWGRHINLWEQA